MTRTKRLLFTIAATALLATAFPLAASAQGAEDAPTRDRATITDDRGIEHLRLAKQRVTHQIQRRLATLDRLATRVDSAKHITEDHAVALLDDYAAAERTLTAGLEAVESVTTLEELREIAPPIFESTHVFALLKPKTQLVIVSDAVAGAEDRYAETAARLQDSLDRLAEEGIDVTGAQTALDSATAIVGDVAAAAEPVADAIIGLNPDDDFAEPLAAAKEAMSGTRRQLREAKTLTKGVIRFVRNNSDGDNP